MIANLFCNGAAGSVRVHLIFFFLGHEVAESTGRHANQRHGGTHDESDLPAAGQAQDDAKYEHGGIHGTGAELMPDGGLNFADLFVHARRDFGRGHTIKPAANHKRARLENTWCWACLPGTVFADDAGQVNGADAGALLLAAVGEQGSP